MARYQYLTAQQAIDASLLDRSVHDDIVTRDPDWHNVTLQNISAGTLDARLSKRYAVPFDVNDPPGKIREWVVSVFDYLSWLKRGIDPGSTTWPTIEARYRDALSEIREASDALGGLFDLPLRDGQASGVTQCSPDAYAEDAYGDPLT